MASAAARGRDRASEDESPSPRVRGEGWGEGESPERWGAYGPALRLGLRMVNGLTEAGAKRIEDARRARPFADVADLARRAHLDRRDLEALADADALASLAGHRHDAVWDVAGVEKLPALLDGGRFDEVRAKLAEPTEGEDVVADYRRLGLTLRRHPVALLRGELAKRRLSTAADILRSPHGRLARTAGIVTGRQRPDTAPGIPADAVAGLPLTRPLRSRGTPAQRPRAPRPGRYRRHDASSRPRRHRSTRSSAARERRSEGRGSSGSASR